MTDAQRYREYFASGADRNRLTTSSMTSIEVPVLESDNTDKDGIEDL